MQFPKASFVLLLVPADGPDLGSSPCEDSPDGFLVVSFLLLGLGSGGGAAGADWIVDVGAAVTGTGTDSRVESGIISVACCEAGTGADSRVESGIISVACCEAGTGTDSD